MTYEYKFCFLFQIQEIVSTGKLSKLEHFENDERVSYPISTSIMLPYDA